MRHIATLIFALAVTLSVAASQYTYNFRNTPISKAILTITKEHPDIKVSFIYNELDKYRTSATINTDDINEAIRQIVGRNPISIICKNGNFYIEAMQHGKYAYSGRAINPSGEPVISASVLLLAPADSTVITYGITNGNGYFNIPCDSHNVIAKLTCVGFMPTYRKADTFTLGDITMTESPVLLENVSIEARDAYLYSDRSVYIPTDRQKKSSQTAEDLINSMAIPQLGMGDEIKTNTGQPVNIYIDFVPANISELAGMRVNDVKRVEYYDYPIDPRFQGNHHVLNFIMQQYEYGGYLKGLYYDNFIYSRQFNGYAKLQYKNMTYDWAGGLYRNSSKDNYENVEETYRLPQTDGSITQFERNSQVSDSRKRNNSCWTSLKAVYRSDKIALSNMVSADFDHTPQVYRTGNVTYSPAEFASTEFTFNESNRINSFIYSGYWYITLSQNNSLTFNPYYAYSHTNQNSVYDETGAGTFINGARDDSHQASGNLSFVHSFGEAGTFKAMCQVRFLQNRTVYSGTSTLSDMARTYRLGPGVNYSYTDNHFYGQAGIGLHWDKSSYGTISENSTAPWASLSVQYSANDKNSLSASLDYSKSIPASSYRSASIVQSNPLMKYTGNPALVPYNSFQADADYTFIPTNRFSLSAFGWLWLVDNRYVFNYEASQYGILRTISQPMGSYAQWQYGLNSSIRLLNKKLRISMALFLIQCHNGEPYNWSKARLTGTVSANYYLKSLYLGLRYRAPDSYPDGCMTGDWMTQCSQYSFEVGWSNDNWNLRFFTRNFFRNNSNMKNSIMNSQYYDRQRHIYMSSFSDFFQISATYTFTFGKKVKDGDEAHQLSGASSGILR